MLITGSSRAGKTVVVERRLTRETIERSEIHPVGRMEIEGESRAIEQDILRRLAEVTGGPPEHPKTSALCADVPTF